MHNLRLAPAVIVLASALSNVATAEDGWWVAPVATVRAWTHWRTVIIPAARPNAKLSQVSTSARGATAAPASKPLTGYAHEMSGLASFYNEMQKTSSGETFDRRALTAAHKTLPLGTRVRVTNLANGRSTVVRINDRGPFKPGRVIDLSEAAAQEIAMVGRGIARVALDIVR